MKAIVFVRSSTEKQELASQIQETTAYAQQLGYDELITIGAKGASAVKLNDIYNEKINELFATIEQDKPAAVVVWHLNRIARNEEMAMKVKNYLIKHHIQLHVKEPTITLLNEDKTVNTGAELAFSLFATMAKQQAAELRAKSRRAKARDKKIGKFLGGVKKFGYTVNENGYVVINEQEAAIVRKMYEIYRTGTMSCKEVAKELNELYGIDATHQFVNKLLKSPCYYDGTYPQIISEELYKECETQRDRRDFKPSQHKVHTFANRIIRCSECGRGYTVTQIKGVLTYKCGSCNGGKRITVSWLDGLLWLVASHLEGDYLVKMGDDKELVAKQADLEAKLKSMDKYTNKAEKGRQRAKEAYLEGIIDLSEYKAKVKKMDDDVREYTDKTARWKEELERIGNLLNENRYSLKSLLTISGQLESMDEVEMSKLVRKWITKVTLDDGSGIMTIETLKRVYACKYVPYSKTGTKYFTIGGRPIAASKLERVRGVSMTLLPPVGDIVCTLAWLSGSVIV